MGAIRKNISGKKYGAWLVIRLSHRDKGGNAYWLCKCECGKEKAVYLYSLTSGKSTNCGCLAVQKRIKGVKKHGRSSDEDLTYRTWKALRGRCNNKNNKGYKNYGKRGINVCKRWDSFENFLSDMGEKPSPKHCIDRIDTNAGYSPENCRWVLPRENAMNTRRSKWWHINGVRYESALVASRELNCSVSKIVRICDGYYHVPPEDGCRTELKYGA